MAPSVPSVFLIRWAIHLQFYDSLTGILPVDSRLDVNFLSLLQRSLEMEHGLPGLWDLRKVINDIVKGAAEDGIHFSVICHLSAPCH